MLRRRVWRTRRRRPRHLGSPRSRIPLNREFPTVGSMARDCEGLGTDSGLWFPSRRSSVTPPSPCGPHWPAAGMSCACALSIRFGLGSQGLGHSPRSSRAGLREGAHSCAPSLPPSAWAVTLSFLHHAALGLGQTSRCSLSAVRSSPPTSSSRSNRSPH